MKPIERRPLTGKMWAPSSHKPHSHSEPTLGILSLEIPAHETRWAQRMETTQVICDSGTKAQFQEAEVQGSPEMWLVSDTMIKLLPVQLQWWLTWSKPGT